MNTDLISDSSASQNLALSRGFAGLAALTFCLIVVGALVRANDAGLACPDWPLCHGEIVPTFDLKVAYEWGHRVFAFAISLGLLILSWRVRRELRLRRRLFLVWTVLAIQIVFGGLTVLLALAPWTVGVHLVLGNFFCLLLLWTARDLAENFAANRAPSELRSGTVVAIGAVCALLFLQMVLGGWVSSHYAGLACLDFPTCDGQSIAPTFQGLVGIHVIHRLNAFMLFGAYAILAFRVRGQGRMAALANWGCALVLLQIGVGVANVLLMLPIPVTALHSGLAAAIVLVTAMLAREALEARSALVEFSPEARMIEAR